MEMVDYKPLGTIIRSNGARKKLMIIARAVSVSLKPGEEKKFFDYACVLYPEGLIGNQLIYVQDSEITEVLFTGFNDEDNKKAMQGLKTVLEKLDVQRYENFLDEERKANAKKDKKDS